MSQRMIDALSDYYRRKTGKPREFCDDAALVAVFLSTIVEMVNENGRLNLEPFGVFECDYGGVKFTPGEMWYRREQNDSMA